MSQPKQPAPHIFSACCLAGLLIASVQPTHAQNSLPLYHCISEDGASSRMSRSPCGPGESGTAKHAQAAQPKAAASITHQRNDVSDQRAKEDADEYERRRHST